MIASRTLGGLVLVVGLSLSACSGDDEPTPKPTGAVDPVIELEDSEGARADLSKFVCEEKSGTWSASGTITNETDQDLDYVVNIGLIKKDRSSDTRKNVELSVAAGKSEKFEVKELRTDAPGGLECVSRVNRGTSK